jgi:hypothetical protein
MQIADAETTYQRFLDARGLTLDDSDGEVVISALLDWYETERADDAAPIKDDGDQLLFQWGTYDWGAGPFFEVSLARQLIASSAADESIRQLSLTFRYPATEHTEGLYRDAWWCRGPEDVPGFRDDILSNPVIELVRGQAPTMVRLTFGMVD